MVKVALAMIVAPTDREAELLDRCLGGVTKSNILPEQREINVAKTDGLAKHVDGIFITITGKNENVERVARRYGAHISYWDWNHSFADARNFNWSQVPEEYGYIMWTDSDDVWENPKLIRGIVQKASETAIDAIILNYLYGFDQYGNCIVKHLKTRIVKNDGCTKWVNDIHEDFNEERRLLSVLNKDLNVIHLTDNKRVTDAFKRNIDIAERALRKNPKDPHSYWNLANTYVMGGEHIKAIPIYLDFLGISNSDEERFLSWHRVANCYKALGDWSRAVPSELEALALRPWYPDSYLALSEMYYEMGKLEQAKEFGEIGLTKKPREDQMIVWNPEDYDYKPKMIMAKVYLGMSKPRDAMKFIKDCIKLRPKDKSLRDLVKEVSPEIKKFDFAENIYKKAQKVKSKKALLKLLDSVPQNMKYYPALIALRNQHFVKTKSSGKDLVIYCTWTEHEWDPKVFATKGVGGSEEAIVQLAKRLAKDWNVTVYCNTPKQQEYVYDGVTWKPTMAWNYRDKQDVTILWRHPKFLDYGINSDQIYVDIHDVIPQAEFTVDRIRKATGFLFKSVIHRKYYPHIPDNKVVVIPHGLDITQFEERAKVVKKNPYKILNTSSPDRSLLTTLELIERIYKALPKSLKPKLKFRWNYGFKVWDVDFGNDQAMLNWKKKALDKLEELKKKGIVEEGSGPMISQDAIVDQYLEAGLLLYPSEFFEIGFIGGIKGALAGAMPVTTNCFAMGEFLKHGIIIPSKQHYTNWVRDIHTGIDYGIQTEEQKEFVVDEVVKYFKNPKKYEEVRKLAQADARKLSWDKTADEWLKIFNDNKPTS